MSSPVEVPLSPVRTAACTRESGSGLDPITTTTISRLIRKVQHELGVTSILVTHDLACAFEVGDRIAMFSEGTVVHEDAVEPFRQTDHPVVRNFLSGGRNGDPQ